MLACFREQDIIKLYTMINKLKIEGRLPATILLMLMTIFCAALSLFRYYITDTKVFLFLNWNLFLAIVPWVISTIVVIFKIKNKFSLILLIIIWILFFPNSPYILTDLFHLRVRDSAPIWYDLIVILSYAWAGLMFGFVSLMDINRLLSSYFNEKVIMLLTIFFLFLSGFGVYLGRYLRWNSWDIIQDPFGLYHDILDRFISPFDHPQTWGVTILMGVLLNFMYFTLKVFNKKGEV